jgi:hypothetical protein
MSSTMLQLVQQVTNELGVSTPNSVAGNTNQDVIQIQALMNACGYELLRIADWRELTIPYQFYTSYVTTTGTYTTSARTITVPDTTGLSTAYQVQGLGIGNATYITSVDSSTQVTVNQDFTQSITAGTVYFQKVKYDLPSDYDSIVPRTMWDKSKRWEMLGPEDAQQWEWLLSGYISTGPRIRWRMLGNTFQIWPGTSTNELLSYEYRSKGWARAADGSVKNSFTADTDTCIYPDRLMVLFTKLKYFEAKGFDTTAMYRNYLTELETVIAQNTSAPNISFAPRPGTVLIGYDNIPDSGYGN